MTTPRTVALTISNVGTIFLPGLKISYTLDQRSTCTFMVHDATGTKHYQPGQPVQVTDSIAGLRFNGYIEESDEKNLYPNPDIVSTITCIDQRFLADKRVAQKDYFNRYAGDIANDLLHTYLAGEGVNLSSSINRSDQYKVDWQQGTLSNLTSAQNVTDVPGGGNLELAASGGAASYAQQQASDFSGTSNLLVYNTALQGVTFQPTQAMKMTGQNSVPGAGNAYTYVKFWQGSYVVPTASPALVYDIWIADSCPQQMCGIDLVFTDGTTLRDTPIYPSANSIFPDQQGVGAHPGNDLSGLATNQWYTRVLPLSGSGFTLGGKTIAYATMAFEGDQQGNYTAYVRNAYIWYYTGSAYATGIVLFSTTATATQSTSQQLQTNGYANVQLTVVTAYEASGSMQSTLIDPSAAGIYNTSLLQWQDSVPASCTDTIQCSVDGGNTWTDCTNNAPLPGFLPGQNLSGVHAYLRYLFTNGNDPTQTPILSSVQTVVNPSYQCTKTDISKTYAATTDWTSNGTLTNLVAQNNTLALNGVARNWDNASYSGQTIFGTNGPGMYINKRTFEIRLNNGAPNEGRSRFDFAGQWANFTAEIDVNLTTAGDEYGLVYRTTGWQNANDTYAYAAWVSTTQIVLARGTNTSTGGGLYTLIDSFPITLSSGNWHRLKVVANGSTHQIYLDNVLYINKTDSTYTAAGYIGARIYSPTQNYDIGQFDNFGVCSALSGQWVSTGLNVGGLTVGNTQMNVQIDPLVNLSQCSVLVEISYNGGTNWFTCTNGQPLPAITPGNTFVSGTLAQLRVTLSTSTASSQIDITAITLYFSGYFQSTGTRVSPASSLAGMTGGPAGSTAITWNGLVPPNTSCTVDSSLDGSTWTNVGTISNATPGNAQIAGINGQPDPTQDTFSANTSSNYTSTAATAGPGGGYAEIVLPDAPLRYYRGNTVDLGSQKQNGTIVGGVTLNQPGLLVGDPQTSMSFDGTSGYMSIPVAGLPSGAQPWTIETWSVISPTDPAGAMSYLFGWGNSAPNEHVELAFWQTYACYNVEGLSTGWGPFNVRPNPAVAHHVAVTYDGTTMTCYIDGASANDTSAQTFAISLTGGAAAGIGSYLGTATGYTPCTLQECAIYGSALSSARISAHYQAGSTGGLAATWTFDTANSRVIASGGENALLLLNSLSSVGDVQTIIDIDTAEDAGIAWHESNTANYYLLNVTDAQSSTGRANAVQLFKIASGAITSLTQAAISFTRGTLHRLQATMQTGAITAYFDGTQLFTYTDASPLASGTVGLFASGLAQYYLLNIQPLGGTITAANAYTRVRMQTSDPTVTPQLTTLTLSAHAPVIGRGNLIAKTNQYAVQNGGTKSIAACLSDLAKQSNYTCQFDMNKNFTFSHRAATHAPRIVQSGEMLVAQGISVRNVNTSYRNSQWIGGGIDTINDSQSFVGDGKKRTFTVKYPVYSQPAVLVNGVPYSVGVKGVDTGKVFYWQQGSATITHDTSLFPLLKTQVLTVNYVGQYPVTINQQSASAIAARAALDGTSGIVEAVESAPQLLASAATTLAQARLGEYATYGKILTFTTNGDGLAVGQQATVRVTQHGILGMQFLFQQIDLTYKTVMQNGQATALPYYRVKAVSGALLYDWTHFFAVMGHQ